MACLRLLTSLLLFFSINIRVNSEGCDLSKLKVKTHKTGWQIEDRMEFIVVISNVCSCHQSNVYFHCNGFNSVELVDPAVFKVMEEGSVCLVNNGEPIVNGRPIAFRYAWDTRLHLSPLSSVITC